MIRKTKVKLNEKKPRSGSKPKTATAKTPEEQIEVNGVTLADLQKMLGPVMDPGIAKVAETMFTAAAAAVKQGKGAGIAVAYSAFFPLAEVVANDISRWVTTVKRRNDASTVKELCEAIGKLDEMEDRALREKLAARLDDLVDQVFPAPFTLTEGTLDSIPIDPGTWAPRPVEAPMEVNLEEFLKEERSRVESAPPAIMDPPPPPAIAPTLPDPKLRWAPSDTEELE